ncbi:unnamed protein product [Polarella glacialis]|uniref:Palmitoyltransferase n=1 Tax=Polarella glacialis TaxID=89957 RepID=A0A813LKS9_POLGL|nr:unnamed protein product [Polarella glacialis]
METSTPSSSPLRRRLSSDTDTSPEIAGANDHGVQPQIELDGHDKAPSTVRSLDLIQVVIAVFMLLAAVVADILTRRDVQPAFTPATAIAVIVIFTLRSVWVRCFPLDMRTVPPAMVVLLLLLGVQPVVMWQAVIGTPQLRPLCVMSVFYGMGYLCISLDSTGLLRWVALLAAKRTARPRSAFLAVACLTAVLTLITSNDIVVLTLTPVIIDLCASRGFDPWPMLYVQYITANVWSISLVVGNPTNVIVADAAGLRFGEYASQLAPAGIVAGFTAVLAVFCRFNRALSASPAGTACLHPATADNNRSSGRSSSSDVIPVDVAGRDALDVEVPSERMTTDNNNNPTTNNNQSLGAASAGEQPNTGEATGSQDSSDSSDSPGSHWERQPKAQDETAELDAEGVLRKRRAWVCSVRLFALLVFAALDGLHGIPLWLSAGVTALAGLVMDLAMDVLAVDGVKRSAQGTLWNMPWEVLPFALSLFIIVEVLDRAGLVANLAQALALMVGSNEAAAIFGIGWIGMLACQVLNNQPMTVLFTKILIHPNFASSVGPSTQKAAMRALIVASNLGANITLIGALAGPMWVSAGLAGLVYVFSALTLVPSVATVYMALRDVLKIEELKSDGGLAVDRSLPGDLRDVKPPRDIGETFNLCMGVNMCAHLACMLTDPGAVPLGDGEDEALPVEEEVDAPPVRRCRHCRIVKPARAHHCSTCCRCISKMDHHCMWTNNCVGMHNQKHFLLFLVYACLHCSAAGLAVLISFAVNGVSLGPAAVPLLACYFARLTASLLREQLDALRRNQTGIELLQGSCGEPRELAETLREVMGGPPGWRWLLPVPVRRGNQQSKRAADESHDC